MGGDSPELASKPAGAVFLSYASQDAEVAQRICEALGAAGIEVWFDQSELRGGDAWDQKIRQQIRDCALFIPVISANTASRREGYFRFEWDLADQRTHMIARDRAFIVPVCVDSAPDSGTDVPESFVRVQWTRLPAGETPPEFVQRVATLLSPAAHLAPTAARMSSGAAPSAPSAWRSRPALLLIGAVAAIGVSYFTLDRLVLSKRATDTSHAPVQPAQAVAPVLSAVPEKSIAVLPFVNMSSEKEQEYFSDGLSEELIDHLAHSPDLKVIARTSSFQFKGKNEDVRTIAGKLGVANLLEGSVRKVGGQLRITAQLVRADNGYHLWSETYDRDAKDIFKVQDEISAAVVSALKVKLAAETQGLNSRGTANTEAYTEYLLGRTFFQRFSKDGYRHAIDAYKKAIELDPQYGSAYASMGLAEAYLADAQGNSAELERAKEDVEKGIALAASSSLGYRYRAWIRMQWLWDWAGARADLEKARALDPRDYDVQSNYAVLLAYLGEIPEAIAETKMLLEVEPLGVSLLVNLGNYQSAMGDWTGAEASYRRAIEVRPADQDLVASLANVLLLQGKAAESLDLCAKVEDDVVSRLTCVAQAEHTLGHASESQRALDQAITNGATSNPYDIALVYAWRGEKNKAFEWLDKAYQRRDMGLSEVKLHRELDSLRGDPRYKALLSKMNMPQ